MTTRLESQCSGGDEMNCTQLQDQSRLGRPTLTASVARAHRFRAVALAGLVVLAGVAGMSRAAPSGGKSNDSALATQDLMNPEAYMQDLAGRMGPDDKKVLLQGVGESKAGSASKGRAVQAPPWSSSRSTSNAAGKQTVSPTPLMGAPKGAVTEVRNTTPQSPAPNATDPAVSPATAAGATVQTTPSRPSEYPSDVPPSVSPMSVRSPVPVGSTPAVVTAPAARAGARTLPVLTAQNSASSPMPQGPVSVERELVASRTGLTLWNEPELVRQVALTQAAASGQPVPSAPEPEVPWTLGGDLGKYRAHAVKEGSRNSGESLQKALRRAGLALGDTANVFVLGYASDRAKPFRENDGKGLFQEPGKVPARAGATIASLGYGLYSILDLATLNALPDPNKPVYQDNNPFVRPLIFTGRTIGGVWKTAEEVGNAVTWGLFDNVTGCVGLVIVDLVEFIKHAGEAVTNVVRAPFHLAAGKKPHDGTDRAMDWILLVPLELASNAVEMKGFSNMEDYKTAFADKGVIGSVLEFGGSTYIVYRAVDDLLDRPKKHKSNRQEDSNQGQTDNPSTPDTPDTPDTPSTPDTPIEDPLNVDYELFYYPSDGTFFIVP